MHIATLVRSLVAALLLGVGHTATAAIIDFSDGAGHNLAAFDKLLSDGSATASFADPVEESSPPYAFFNLSLGLSLGSGGLAHTWTVTFDSTVTLVGITLGYSSANLGFDIVGAGVNVTDLLAGAGTGAFSISPLTFQAGEAYQFTSNNLCAETSCGGVSFQTWTFGEAGNVPTPASLALIGLGLAGLAGRRRRGDRVG